MYIWFPYNIPSLSSFKGSLSDFEHLGLHGSEHRYFLDSVPVGILQMVSTPENLRSWLQKSVYNRYGKDILQK